VYFCLCEFKPLFFMRMSQAYSHVIAGFQILKLQTWL